MIACCIAHHAHIACVRLLKPFFTLTINNNNYVYCNIIIYKLNTLINVMILKILI